MYFCVSVMDDLAKQRLAELIKDLRGGLTQREFAKRLGVTYSAIQSWENAEVTPNSNNLVKIADYTGLSLQELMSRLTGSKVGVGKAETNPLYVVTQLKTMSVTDLAHLYRAVGDRLVAIAESAGR
jgi:transcriptional regulator with XRE-family HTH domain